MKTLTRFLIESDAVRVDNGRVIVYKNPTPRDAIAMADEESTYGSVRFLVNTKGDYWVWDAGKLIHVGMANELGLNFRHDVTYYGELYMRGGPSSRKEIELYFRRSNLRMIGPFLKFINDPAFRKFSIEKIEE